jgi:hypothetical protein
LTLTLEDKDPVLHRKLRDTLRNARGVGKLLILLGVWKPLPAELKRELTRLDLALACRSIQLPQLLVGSRPSAKVPGETVNENPFKVTL